MQLKLGHYQKRVNKVSLMKFENKALWKIFGPIMEQEVLRRRKGREIREL